jgi:putative hydrolase of HD superfamily
MNNELKKIFAFIQMVGKLKTTYRFGTNEHFLGDSSADHSWRLALMTFMMVDQLGLRVDALRSVKLALVHDLAESITGDVDARLIKEKIYSKKDKQDMEAKAMKDFYDVLPERMGREIYELWLEYENAETEEARFVKAMDKIETLTHLVEKGQEVFDDVDLVGVYGNEEVRNFPDLKKVFMVVKEQIRKELDNAGISWKEEYNNY